MIKQTIITYTEEDKKLLKRILPDNPCNECHDSYACCGCSESRKYEEHVQKYKDNGIYNIALLLKERNDKINIIQELTRRIEEIEKQPPDFLRSCDNDDNMSKSAPIAMDLFT